MSAADGHDLVEQEAGSDRLGARAMPKGGLSGLWIVDHADIPGGGQRFALRLARYAVERAHLGVRMVCPADSVLADWCRDAGLAVTDADFPPFTLSAISRMPAALQHSRRLLKAVRSEEVIVANSARVQAYLFAASRVQRTDSHVVNLMHEQDSALRPSARFAYRRFGSLLVIGDAAAAAYRGRLPGLAVHEANNFLLEEDLADFEALREERIPRDGPMVLGTLGRLIPEKGLVELVGELAADQVRPLWARLILAAVPQDEAYERRLRARIGELGLANAVELVGPRPAAAVLADVDALLVPSVGYEAQPTVILEALAAGIPVIVRSPLWSTAYQDLPLLGYGSTDELASALRRLPLAPASPSSIADRFGPKQFIMALEAAA